MAELSSNRIAWNYTDDLGKIWRVAALKAITDQGLLGGSASGPSVPPKPANIHMRRATVRSAAGVSRTVPLYDNTQTLVTDEAINPINLNIDQVSTVMTPIGSVIAERRPRVSVTSQST